MKKRHSSGFEYFENAETIIRRMRETQLPNLARAAEICANSIQHGGLVHLFGTGHSRIGVEEIFPRHGSFPGFHPIVELSLSYYSQVVGANGLRQEQFLERVEGLGDIILQNYDFGESDSFIIFSNSGVNGVIIDVALGAQSRNLPVIGVMSVEHCKASPVRHSSGKRLLDIVDVVLDNCSPTGDASVRIDGLNQPIAPLSTLGYVLIVNTLRCLVAEHLIERGVELPVITSGTLVGHKAADVLVENVYREHRKRTSRL